jgi:xanthine/uracil/vitamin C permease (AzgA family)
MLPTQHAVPAFITIVTMPMCYSIAYGVIAGCCSYIVLYLGNFLLDLIGVALGQDNMQNVLYNNCPDAFQDKMKVPVPFKSPSAVLQVRERGCKYIL